MFPGLDNSKPTFWQNLQCSLFKRCPKTLYESLSELSKMYCPENLNLKIVAFALIILTLTVLYPWIKTVKKYLKTTVDEAELLLALEYYPLSDEKNVQLPRDSANPVL